MQKFTATTKPHFRRKLFLFSEHLVAVFVSKFGKLASEFENLWFSLCLSTLILLLKCTMSKIFIRYNYLILRKMCISKQWNACLWSLHRFPRFFPKYQIPKLTSVISGISAFASINDFVSEVKAVIKAVTQILQWKKIS